MRSDSPNVREKGARFCSQPLAQATLRSTGISRCISRCTKRPYRPDRFRGLASSTLPRCASVWEHFPFFSLWTCLTWKALQSSRRLRVDEMNCRRLVALLPCVACVVFAGCSTVPQISIKERWNQSINNFALVPIYPMLEQVYIGDLRLFVDKSSPYGLSSRYIGHVDGIENELYTKETKLPTYPKTKTPPSLAKSPPMWVQPDDQISPPGSVTQQRLRRAAFPSMALVSVTDGELGGSGLSGLWSWIVGGSVRSEATLNLSLFGVETLELDDISAYAATIEYLNEQVGSTDDSGSDAFKEGVCAAATSLGDPRGETSKIAVITRAFYARGIQYTYGDTFAASLRAAAGEGERPSLPREEMEAGVPLAPEEDEAPAPDGDEGKAGDGTNTVAVDLAELDSRTTPGLIGRFATVRDDRLALTDTFERPMAFGVDVLVLSLSDIGINCASVEVKVGERTDAVVLRGSPEEK